MSQQRCSIAGNTYVIEIYRQSIRDGVLAKGNVLIAGNPIKYEDMKMDDGTRITSIGDLSGELSLGGDDDYRVNAIREAIDEDEGNSPKTEWL
jgi:hypothetical protein